MKTATATTLGNLSESAVSLAPAMAAGTSIIARPGRSIAARWTDFYELTKPRMNVLVLATTLVGYYMAAQWSAGWMRLIHTMLGTALTAAAASVLNQHAERAYDALMPRTANRPLPAGRVRPVEALIWGLLLGIAGLTYLLVLVNPLTALLGALTLGSYVWIYTPLKRHTSLCTIVGAIPGAIPPVMGWTAVRNDVGPEALVLFGILFLWQMPHFLAIAMLYRKDYAAGGFKMLPVIDPDLSSTSRQIIVYGLSLIPMSLMPVGLGMANMAYSAAAIVLGLGFCAVGVRCAMSRTRTAARALFVASIIYLPLLLAWLTYAKI